MDCRFIGHGLLLAAEEFLAFAFADQGFFHPGRC